MARSRALYRSVVFISIEGFKHYFPLFMIYHTAAAAAAASLSKLQGGPLMVLMIIFLSEFFPLFLFLTQMTLEIINRVCYLKR